MLPQKCTTFPDVGRIKVGTKLGCYQAAPLIALQNDTLEEQKAGTQWKRKWP